MLQLFRKTTALLRTSRKVESQIDEFLDQVVSSGLVFSRAFDVFLKSGACQEFDNLMYEVQAIERKGDELRRSIETELYSRTLIPDLRSDVLRLVESVDKLTNIYKANLFRLSIQKPEIPGPLKPKYAELVRLTIACAEAVVVAARLFFRDHEAVRDSVKKVVLLETEADKVSSPLQRQIFDSDLDLGHKMHLRYIVERLDELANQAEDIADQLAISAIKRRI
ncbi:MAG: DUF47 family protein [Arenicellales bacterium]|nr:DUF47 family protein [Arenicellales bacterium]